MTLVISEVVVDLSVPHTLLASSMGTNFLRGLTWLGVFALITARKGKYHMADNVEVTIRNTCLVKQNCDNYLED